MYSGIEIPLGREQAKGSPASPRDARRLLPTRARQRAGDHCGLKNPRPAPDGHTSLPSQTSSVYSDMPEPSKPASWLNSG